MQLAPGSVMAREAAEAKNPHFSHCLSHVLEQIGLGPADNQDWLPNLACVTVHIEQLLHAYAQPLQKLTQNFKQCKISSKMPRSCWARYIGVELRWNDNLECFTGFEWYVTRVHVRNKGLCCSSKQTDIEPG
jgi:hypothetical protein